MAWGLRSQRNVSPSTVGPSKLEQPVSLKKTPATNNVGPPDASAPDVPDLIPVLTTTFTNELFQQFIKAYIENQNQALSLALI